MRVCISIYNIQPRTEQHQGMKNHMHITSIPIERLTTTGSASTNWSPGFTMQNVTSFSCSFSFSFSSSLSFLGASSITYAL